MLRRCGALASLTRAVTGYVRKFLPSIIWYIAKKMKKFENETEGDHTECSSKLQSYTQKFIETMPT